MAWSGFSGAPGYTNFHFEGSDTPTQTQLDETAAKVRTFFQAFVTYLPTPLTITYPSEIEQFQTENGVLSQTWPIAPPANTVGTGVGQYSSAAGACINWTTNTIVNGRRIRGRTFMVPLLPANAFQSDGTLAVAAVVAFNSAATGFRNNETGLPFVIWHRPSLGGVDGDAGPVTASSVSDMTAVLRSRRD